jgi:methyltransferase
MSSVTWFTVLIAAVAAERLIELVVSARHLRWAKERGGVESGAGHYPLMAAVHTLFLVSCIVEVHVADRAFVPWLGWPMLVVVAGTQALRWWCVRTLGPQWNTRIVVVPGLPLVSRGPYRLLRHPNYVAVVVEIAALPLVHTAWVTAIAFSALNVLVLSIRIPAEQRALAAAA